MVVWASCSYMEVDKNCFNTNLIALNVWMNCSRPCAKLSRLGDRMYFGGKNL